jgi:predicted glutamine amidotransferase
MCVIAVKKPGINVPDENNIKDMWEANSDGAGFMYAIKGKVYIEKGFMKLNDLTNALKHLEKKAKKTDSLALKDIPMVFHFRIKTHGANSASNTHPFPISSKEQHLKALDLTTPLGMVHNGIIATAKPMGDMSDTMSYIANVLTPLAMLDKNFYKTEYGKTLMENTIGYSKLAFLDGDGVIELVGDFKAGTKEGTTGILYSNLSHEYQAGSTYAYNTYGMDNAFEKGFENLKEIPVGYYVGYSKIGSDNQVKAIAVPAANTYFSDKDGFVYINSGVPNIFNESYTFSGIYLDEGKKYLTEVDFKDLPTKPILGEINYSNFNYRGTDIFDD